MQKKPVICLVMATLLEAKPFVKGLSLKRISSKPFPVYSGGNITAVISGIGKANAAMATAYACLELGPRLDPPGRGARTPPCHRARSARLAVNSTGGAQVQCHTSASYSERLSGPPGWMRRHAPPPGAAGGYGSLLHPGLGSSEKCCL